jgi:hypothetical protein
VEIAQIFSIMRIFLLSFFTVLTLTLFGQSDPNTGYVEIINFDSWYDTTFISLEVDTMNQDNIWQIGSPQKVLFNQANSQPNVIITDTINNYPINDTSSFIVRYNSFNCPIVFGKYSVDTDSLNDFGMIEISLDTGQTWINVLEDSLNYSPNKPILTGNSNGWKDFELNLTNYQIETYENLFILRFSFISDSIDTQQEGLMFDDLVFCISVNTKNISQLNNLKIFPNPATDLLNFQLEEPINNAEIRIYSTLGQLINTQNINDTNTQFNVSEWQNGMYFYGIFVAGEMVKSGQVLIVE